MPLVPYIDFETTAPTVPFKILKIKKMFVVSYVMIFAFHLELKLERAIIEPS